MPSRRMPRAARRRRRSRDSTATSTGAAPDWRERSRTVWREVLAGYAVAFSATAAGALPTFVNKPEPFSVPAELVAARRSLRVHRRVLSGVLRLSTRARSGRPAGLESVLYWSKEDFGVRPVLRLSHQTIYRAAAPPRALLVATNQIYADHYLDAGLTVTMAIDAAGAGGGPGVLHDRGQPRAHAFAQRNPARVRAQDGAEPQPRRLRKILASTKTSLEQHQGIAGPVGTVVSAFRRTPSSERLQRPEHRRARARTPSDGCARRA